MNLIGNALMGRSGFQADLGRMFCEEATLIKNQYGRDLAFVQSEVVLDD